MQLSDPLSSHFRLDERQKAGLKKLGLLFVQDLLFYFPTRYTDMSIIKRVADLIPGETATLYGIINNPKTKKTFKSKTPMAEATFTDETGSLKVMWFHQAYIAKMLQGGEKVILTGKVMEGKQGLYFSNPEFEKVDMLPIDSHDSLFKKENAASGMFGYPIYPETRAITSKWIYHAIDRVFKSGVLDSVEDYIPPEIIKKYFLPTLRTALIFIHTPQKASDAEAARKRFAFEEVFLIQLAKQQDRHQFKEKNSYTITVDDADIQDFVDRFPFHHTGAQTKAITTILEDFQKPHPMARLLEGDVGSGKTAVAATVSYAIIKNRPPKTGKEQQAFGNLQVAYMAPTEILATQLFENFITFFKHTGINIGLITGSGCRKFPSKVAASALSGGWTSISRPQLLKWVANGEIPILVGTHALIQKSVKFKHLALVIIDEQHRFGTMQRSKLARKEGFAPHLLSMTATPIPRTLALTIYGDLDLTLLDEMPAGRKEVMTAIVPAEKREEAYAEIKKELALGRQLYIICPRINEPDPTQELALQARSVTEEAKRLKKDVFQEYEIDILHSKMTKEKKEAVMQDFASGATQILVATSVVEVGVNVPNATVIVIEGAERFGLAQLHQLRGRVLRSSHQAYCYLFAESKSAKTADRLKALRTAKNGFELSELDLALRGAGELGGGKQWGITDLGMEAIKNIKMVEAARAEATTLIARDPELHNYPVLKSVSASRHNEMHFE